MEEFHPPPHQRTLLVQYVVLERYVKSYDVKSYCDVKFEFLSTFTHSFINPFAPILFQLLKSLILHWVKTITGSIGAIMKR